VNEDLRDVAAGLFDEAADELERAVANCRVAAEDFRNRDVPHGVARAWAALGHVLAAEGRLHEQARMHSQRVAARDDAG
jgi:hypothetical protein